MLQEVMTAAKTVTFREIAVPEPEPGQVLLRMEAMGICGSDVHVYHGAHPFTSFPVTQGHEVSGMIVAVGEGVCGLCPGQKVTVQPQIVCGVCHPCCHGKKNACENLKVMGFQAPGLAAHFCAVDADKIVPLLDTMTYTEGAMIEPLAVGVHAAERGEVAGKKVAVIGAGPIGNLLAQAARGLGAADIMVTDISPFRLKKAEECGISKAYDTRTIDFGAAVANAFGPEGADIIYDCAGNDQSMGQAIRYARKGSTILLVAVFAKPATLDLAVLNDHELDLKTSMMYWREDFDAAIRLVSEGKVQLQPLVSQHFPFQALGEAYAYIDANKETTMKVIIDIQK